MHTVTLEVELPREMFSFGLSKEEIVEEVERWLVFSLFRSGRISSGKAAELLGISRIEFLELLHAQGIAYFDYSDEELEAEFAAARDLTPVGEEE